MYPGWLEDIAWLSSIVDCSMIRSTTAGLEEITGPPVKSDNSVTEAVVSDLRFRGLPMSLMYVEALPLVEPWISEVVTRPVALRVSAVFDSCSVVIVTVGLLKVWMAMDSPTGLWVDE